MAATTITAPERTEEAIEPKARRQINLPGWLSPVASVLSGASLIALHATVYRYWLIDDAGITFAYARQVAEGHGPVFQEGAPPLEGFSDPAWLGLLTLGKLVGLFDRGAIFGIPDYVLFPKAIALLLCAGMLALFYSAARRVTSRPGIVTFATGAVLAAIPSFVIWCFSGLENSLYGFTVVLLAVVMFRAVLDDRLLAYEIALGTGLLVGLSALTRPDGAIYVVAYPIVVLIRLRRSVWQRSALAILLSVVSFAGVYGAYLGWRHVEFGRWVALTTVSKRQGFPEVAYLARTGVLVQYVGALGVLAVVLVVGMALTRPSRLRDGMVALLVPLVLALVAYAVLEPDWMGELRFATPVWCLAAFIAVLSVNHLLPQVGLRGRLVLVVGLVVALIPTADAFKTGAEKFRADPTVPLCVVAERNGRVFNGYADILGKDNQSVVTPDVGASGLISRLRVIDLAGLVDERTAEAWGAWDMAAIRDYVLNEVKPTFLHTHQAWTTNTGIVSDPRMQRDYVPIFVYPEEVPAGDWVRKDAVRDSEQLAELHNYAVTVMRPAEEMTGHSKLGHCGPTLRPGQLPWRPSGAK